MWKSTVVSAKEYARILVLLFDIQDDLTKLTLVQRSGHVGLVLSTHDSPDQFTVLFSPGTHNLLSVIEPDLILLDIADTTHPENIRVGYAVLFGDLDVYLR